MTKSSMLKQWKERKHMVWLLKTQPESIEKEPLSSKQALAMFLEVRRRNISGFGVCALAKLQLDDRWPFPKQLTREKYCDITNMPDVTLMEYSCLFGEKWGAIVTHFLLVKAKAVIEECDYQQMANEFIHTIPRIYGAWLMGHIVKMAFHETLQSGQCMQCDRHVASHEGETRGDMLHIWPTCNHFFCGHCVWHAVCNEDMNFKCPFCNCTQPDDVTTPVPTKETSKALFDSLPDELEKTRKERKKTRTGNNKCLPMAEVARYAPGSYKAKRLEKFQEAVERGELWRVKGLLTVGVDVDRANEYGLTPLMHAAWRGHTEVMRFLEEYGADQSMVDNGGMTYIDIFRENYKQLHDETEDASQEGSNPAWTSLPRWTVNDLTLSESQVRYLIDPNENHPGAGSLIIDHFLPEAWLQALDHYAETLPRASQREKGRPCSHRSYLCDVTGWVVDLLRQATALILNNNGFSFFPQMRFLIYDEVGTFLAPHIDLTRTNLEGITSTHTFIVYLADCEAGGETALLRRLPGAGYCGTNADDRDVLSMVKPKRGRLLLFPHHCPHEGRETLDANKTILRGEAFRNQ